MEIVAVNMEQCESLLKETQMRIAGLEDEIARSRRLVVALKAMMVPLRNHDDSVKEATQAEPQNRVPDYLQEKSLFLLRLIELEEKRVKTISDSLKAAGIPVEEPSLRAKLSYYKKNFSFVESPRPGFYKLSEKARDYLNKNYPRKVLTMQGQDEMMLQL